jgi:hypothetical protein
MFRRIVIGIALAAIFVGSANAEAWYLISAARTGATILDADSKILDQNVYLVIRVVHPGISVYQSTPLIASQFKDEFDCKANRFRTVHFAMIDLNGHVAKDLATNEVHEWVTIDESTPAGEIKHFACDGALPKTAKAPYKDFADFYSKFLMWVGNITPEIMPPKG